MEFHDPEKSTPTVSQLPAETFSDSGAIAGQSPDAKHTVDRAQSSADVHTSDDSPTDADPSTEDAAPDTEPDPEALTRVPSGPAYSAFSPAMKKWIITVVSFTSFISPMTAVSTLFQDYRAGPRGGHLTLRRTFISQPSIQ